MAWYNENNYVNHEVIKDSVSGAVKELNFPTTGCCTTHKHIRLFISLNGDDNNSGVDAEHPIRTMDKACSMMNDGRTDMRLVFLTTGTYDCHTTIFNNVSMHLDANTNTFEDGVIIRFVNSGYDETETYDVVWYNSHLNVNGSSKYGTGLISLQLSDDDGFSADGSPRKNKLYFEGCTLNFGRHVNNPPIQYMGSVGILTKRLDFYGCSVLFNEAVIQNLTGVYFSKVRFYYTNFMLTYDIGSSENGMIRIDRKSDVEFIGISRVSTQPVQLTSSPNFIYCLRSRLHVEVEFRVSYKNLPFGTFIECHGGELDISRSIYNDDPDYANSMVSIGDGCIINLGLGVDDKKALDVVFTKSDSVYINEYGETVELTSSDYIGRVDYKLCYGETLSYCTLIYHFKQGWLPLIEKVIGLPDIFQEEPIYSKLYLKPTFISGEGFGGGDKEHFVYGRIYPISSQEHARIGYKLVSDNPGVSTISSLRMSIIF